MMKLDITQLNRLGNRETNEDRLVVVDRGDAVLVVVADGMGGHRGGDIAAQIFVDTLENIFRRVPLPLSNPKTFLNKAIDAAHQTICHERKNHKTSIDPRTTCVVCILQGNSANWAHVGDSRLYLLREQKILARTIDHSYVEELFRQGLISEADMLTHPKRSYLTQCVGGVEQKPSVTYGVMKSLQEHDVLVLCSDGFWTALDEQALCAITAQTNLDESIHQLASMAESNSYPQSDNISAVALRVISLIAQQSPQTAKSSKSNGKSAQADNVDHAVAAITQALEDYQNEMDYDPDTK